MPAIKKSDACIFFLIFSEYESAMSDIEETMSILSRRSRSTTPISATLQRNNNPLAGLELRNNGNLFANPAVALENMPYGSLDRRLKTRSKYLI